MEGMVNGEDRGGKGFSEAAGALRKLSATIQRTAIAAAYGQTTFGGARDTYAVLGYKPLLTFDDHWKKYERQDIGSRIIRAYPNACWRDRIIVSDDGGAEAETPFEKAWIEFERRLRVVSAMRRADVLSRIGRYGLLLIGLADGVDLSRPVQPGNLIRKGPDAVTYLRPFVEDDARIKEWDGDASSPRFGRPTLYELRFDKDRGGLATRSQALTSGAKFPVMTPKTVHFTRVIHIAEDAEFNEDFGVPALRSVFNRLEDWEKVVGGTPEMYWRNARAIKHVNVKDESDGSGGYAAPGEAGDSSTVYEEMRHEIEKLVLGLDDFFRTINTDVKILAPTPPKPKEVFEMTCSAISAATGIPRRILMGSEVGSLASSQDLRNFDNERAARCERHCGPNMLRALIDRLIEWRLIPAPKDGPDAYAIDWPTLFDLDEGEQASVAQKKAQSVYYYTQAQAQAAKAGQPMPIGENEFRAMIDLGEREPMPAPALPEPGAAGGEKESAA